MNRLPRFVVSPLGAWDWGYPFAATRKWILTYIRRVASIRLFSATAKALTIIILAGILYCLPSFPSQWGVFKGEVVTRWLEDGRRMRLIENFSYIDPTGREWFAPKGIIIDGASIPKPFWSIIGGPYEGPYRNASVIHDHYCETWKKHRITWQQVHKAFYNAMMASNVPKAKAIAMYVAVMAYGPRWPTADVPTMSMYTPLDFKISEELRRLKVSRLERQDIDRIESFAEKLAVAKPDIDPDEIMIEYRDNGVLK